MISVKFNSLFELTYMLSSTNFKKMPNLKIFNKLLLTSNSTSNFTSNSTSYISKHNKINNLNTLRCYKSYNNSNDLICNLDYIINSEKKYVKIDYLYIMFIQLTLILINALK